MDMFGMVCYRVYHITVDSPCIPMDLRMKEIKNLRDSTNLTSGQDKQVVKVQRHALAKLWAVQHTPGGC